ncbi:Uncharacterised protein [Mycobacterium tuberculosis]|uniref:Uncharacterized protein n=1 Tax=Mycobacterium tuberculosis TaxID=1773 RepID=A0A655FMI0_MYCTX|nr:Uncharacterised protein [Mycobacterium tuberculosis]CKU01071.1 Uncharacterised protein [Mycobacterium tuberculosis]CMO09097.1 Uncharacterised protein [Mycobacterium tuberculosis]CNV89548.1 Uncharacterised protein [Mycobacterium tuberculosis]CNW41656.1 Uncharacterised protein [Mycobacterium tuberculosis]
MGLRDLVIRDHADDGLASLRNGSGPSLATTSATSPSSIDSHTVGPRKSVPNSAPTIRIRTCPAGSGSHPSVGRAHSVKVP